MELSTNTITVLKARYLLKDEQGRVIESPREMFGRITRSIAATAATTTNIAPTGTLVRFSDVD